ncbi:hypothetical protein ANCDUO_16119 [Ancylostoma duodenale]|uniref:Ig-like domain-containing protein n=1 Tax=Ancylostoma duodenale TaxID=51022 RepID=A0A0C2CV74_9BILA|nr:hypothetical protein ANCDUO_16119 [Ancylostoma duodenale]
MQAKAPTVRVPLGGLARLVCTAESWPRPDVTWDKDGQQIFDSDNYATLSFTQPLSFSLKPYLDSTTVSMC